MKKSPPEMPMVVINKPPRRKLPSTHRASPMAISQKIRMTHQNDETPTLEERAICPKCGRDNTEGMDALYWCYVCNEWFEPMTDQKDERIAELDRN